MKPYIPVPNPYETYKEVDYDSTSAGIAPKPIQAKEIENSGICWMRHINVRLYSKDLNQYIIYGENRKIDENGKEEFRDSLNIVIDGYKKIATAANYGVVQISNLSYEDIIKIIDGKFYKIEIWAGYYMGSFRCYYSGTVAFISQKISTNKDYTAYITFANDYIANWTQQRLNFNLNSGINMYAAFEYMAKRNGFESKYIDPKLKNIILNKSIQMYGTAKSFTDMLSDMQNDVFATSDPGAWGEAIDISTLDGKAQYIINDKTLIFESGNPTLDKTGLHFRMMPTYNFNVGDIVIVDNRLIDISESNVSENKTAFKSMYLDTTLADAQSGYKNFGQYMIREIHFHFENRGMTFCLEVTAKALSLVENWFYE